MVCVTLDYVTPEDWELAHRESSRALRWARLTRFTTQARHQGAALTQPDLSLLLGLSTKAIQSLGKEHPNVVLPTRGLVADMGPALSHADKIVRLFMDGYTETEIVRRTGHTYDSVERYLLDFARVVYLAEQGLPLPAIHKVLGFSRRLVAKYLDLYREFSGPDYFFTMARIRRLAQRPTRLKKREGGLMLLQAKKGVPNRYATLLARDVLHVQTAHLKTRFELAPASTVAEKVAQFTNQALRDWEQTQGHERLRPGELLLHRNGRPLVLPLLAPEALRQLARGVTPRAVQRELEMLQYQSLKRVHPEASLEDLWQTLHQTELPLRRGGREDYLLESPLNANRLEAACRHFVTGELPAEVLKPVVETLVAEWGLRSAQAQGMVALAAQIYARCCPRLEELKPGQLVWLALGIRKSRRTDPRLFVPVVLTLLTPEEVDFLLASRADLKRLKVRQIERY